MITQIQIQAMFRNTPPTLTPATLTRVDLAAQIHAALTAGANQAAVEAALVAAGFAPADATASATAIYTAWTAAPAPAPVPAPAPRSPRSMLKSALWAALLTVLIMLVLRAFFGTPSDKEFGVATEAIAKLEKQTAPLVGAAVATNARLTGLETVVSVHGKRLNAAEKKVDDLVTKANTEFGIVNAKFGVVTTRLTVTESLVAGIRKDLANTDASLANTVASLQATTEFAVDTAKKVEDVEKRLSYRARCQKADTDPACIAQSDCKGARCYKRVPFTPASASEVARLRRELEARKAAEAIPSEAVPAPTPETAPATCPTGCVRDCPTGCVPAPVPAPAPAPDTSINLEVPHGAEVRVNGAVI